MKDRSIIWISAGGIALWIFCAYAPVRDPIIHTARNILRDIADIF